MKKFKTFINNLRYLTRYSLKEMHNSIPVDLEYELDHIKYELNADFENIKKIKFCDSKQTIEKLVNSNCSLCRLGDGEFNLMFGNDIPFQRYSDNLSQRLKEVLSSSNENLMICIPNLFASLENATLWTKTFSRTFFGKHNRAILNLLNNNQQYYDTGATSLYINSTSSSLDDYKNHFDSLKNLWTGKDIAIICGESVFNKIKFNIFEDSNSIEYIKAPSLNAYNQYNEILLQAQSISKNKLILIILGPTATILAYDLSKLGYRALDIGHLAKDYNAWKMKLQTNDIKVVQNFFAPD